MTTLEIARQRKSQLKAGLIIAHRSHLRLSLGFDSGVAAKCFQAGGKARRKPLSRMRSACNRTYVEASLTWFDFTPLLVVCQ